MTIAIIQLEEIHVTNITTCQVCGRVIKSKSGVIAHHGYTRPYEGWQTSSCAGARYLPYEVSCDRLREVIEEVVYFLARIESERKDFLENPPEEIVSYEKNYQTWKDEKQVYAKPVDFDPARYYGTPHTYGCAYVERKYNYERTIRATKADLEMMRKRFADWKPPSTN